jgi:hypothetical protein
LVLYWSCIGPLLMGDFFRLRRTASAGPSPIVQGQGRGLE